MISCLSQMHVLYAKAAAMRGKIDWGGSRRQHASGAHPRLCDILQGGCSNYFWLRIFQRFRLVKFIENFKTRVKNLKIEKTIAFDKYLHELFFAVYFHRSKIYFLR